MLVIAAAAIAVACKPKATAVIEPLKTSVKHAGWTRNMVLYEINVRQFSEEGTFAGVEKALPVLMLAEDGVHSYLLERL